MTWIIESLLGDSSHHYSRAASQCCLIWGKFPIWGKNDMSVGIFFRSLCRKWGIFGRVSFKYLGNFKIPYVVNGEFIEIFWGISKNCLATLQCSDGSNP
jgi:hypothetical protein